jgi:hypothetical protein
MLEAVKIDSGNLAEVVGSMIILIAIDEAENSVEICLPGEIKNLIYTLTSEMPELESLWMKKEYILEPENHDDFFVENFHNYHIVTVRNF